MLRLAALSPLGFASALIGLMSLQALAGGSVVAFTVSRDRLEVDSRDFVDVAPGFGPNSVPIVYFKMSPAIARKFGDFTSRHVGEVMDMLVCGRKVMSPRILDPIFWGAVQASGNFTAEESVKLAEQMKTGECPPVSALPRNDFAHS